MRARLVKTALITALLTGCQSPATGLSPAVLDDPMSSAPPIEQGLDAQGLATLLTAELAGQRGDYPRAARGYLRAAQRYGSVALAECAALAARYANDTQLLVRAAEYWQQLAADAEAPVRLLAGLAMERGDWQASLQHRLSLAARGGQGELAAFAETLIDENVPLAPLITDLRQFVTNHPEHSDAILATALLEAASGNTRQAETRLATLAATRPELPALWLIRARIALQDGRLIDARNAARRGLDVAANDSRLVLLLAQAQLRLGNIEAAESSLDTLVARHPDALTLRLALAQLYLEEGHGAPARRLLLPMTDNDQASPLVYILLGSIAEQEGNVDNALLYYRQVPPGDGFLEARLRAAQALATAGRLPDARDFLRIERLRHSKMRGELVALEVDLLDQQDQPDAAMTLLDRQLRHHSDDLQLRFLRAMRRYERGDLANMERDLRYIIGRDPTNAMALNALGYTLVDATERHAEGLELIQRAHQLQPDSPAILDSLGWAYHKLGDNSRALPYLREAYAGQPDQEIAAHLAEVLWQLGQHAEARRVIAEASRRPDVPPTIEALLERIPELDPSPQTAP